MANSKRSKPGGPNTPSVPADERRSKPSIPLAIRESVPETVEEVEAEEQADEFQPVRNGEPGSSAQGQPQGESGSSDEPGSPEPAQDYLEPDYDTPDGDKQEEDEGEPAFTQEDEARYRLLDARIDKGERESFEALREIRRKDYWQLERDEDGKPLYKSFQEWVEEHKGRDKTWATKGTNWLAVMEAQERLGIAYPLGLKAAQALNAIKGREKCQAVCGLTALLKEAYEVGRLDKDGRISYDGLKSVVDTRLGFFLPAGDKPAAAGYQQYRQDYRKTQEWAKSLPVKTSYTVMAETLHRGLPQEHLKAVCKEKRLLPRPDDLLSRYTGDALDAALADLNLIAKELDDDQRLLVELAKKKADLKAQKKLREEAKALQKQAEEKGLIKKQAKHKAADKNGQAKPKLKVHDGEEEEEEEDGEEQCEVKGRLDDALEFIREALDSEEWPEPEQTDRLIGIKEAAANCRDTAVKVLNKADELLTAADVEPEQIPSE